MLGSTCKSMRASCSEGEVWRLLLSRDYAGAQITATHSSDWYPALSPFALVVPDFGPGKNACYADLWDYLEYKLLRASLKRGPQGVTLLGLAH
jgi:hypothetical protein